LKLSRVKAALDALKLNADDDFSLTSVIGLAGELACSLIDGQPFRCFIELEAWLFDVPVIHHLPTIDDSRPQITQ
jgi:hypothetical protein